MNPAYYEEMFAATVVQQASLFWPLVVQNTCQGCQLGGSSGGGGVPHLCHLPTRVLVDFCFAGTLTLLDKDGAELQFRSYLYPRPVSVLDDEAWFERLWADGNWLRLVRDKLVSLLEGVANS